MADDKKTDAEMKADAEETKTTEATQGKARGNVHSEPEPPVEQEAPPPLPH